MYEKVFSNASFPQALLKLDADLAAAERCRPCRECGAAMHVANYPRKPRGGPWALGPEQAFRHGLCCSREGCRQRVLPASVRYLGRRVYLGAVVVLGAALQHGLSERRVTHLAATLGVDRRTLVRWRRWWLEEFPQTRAGEELRALLVPPGDPTTMPLSWLDRMTSPCMEARLHSLLGSLARWLGPPGAC